MDSASLSLIAFGLVAAVLMAFSRAPLWRSGVLLLANLVFLHEVGATPANIVPLAGFLAFGFVGLKLLPRFAGLLPPLLVACVLLFTYLKKYAFFPDAMLIPGVYFTLGLSYIFFRVMHLLIEARESDASARPGAWEYLCYTLNFTTLVSGPIQRFDDFKKTLEGSDAPLGADVVLAQLARIVKGYFKVNVVASMLDILRVNALISLGRAAPSGDHAAALLTLVVVYPFFLYANFSGYIDIVIALARLMRIRLPENFDRPFSASSFIDFWNRWHITLSQWLKFYVYNPLLMFLMRRISSVAVQPYLGVLCFFVTFFLIGVWHGRTSEYAVFGLLQGGGVAVNKLWQIHLGKRLGRKGYKALAENATYQALGRGLTFSWFAFTMFWFWGNWAQIRLIAASASPIVWIAIWVAVIATSAACLTAIELLHRRLHRTGSALNSPTLRLVARSVLLGSMISVAFFYCALLDQPAPGIVYKAF
jgi:alginate O-acetyltransferase complex protein AlgI